MHSSQFNFRPRRGTADTLMVIRRMIDAAFQRNQESWLLLLLDWLKTFDRIKTPQMFSALRRFGLPPDVVEMIGGIYRARFFVIQDHTGTSSERCQNCGIAQGCPLSPYLFIMVQTVMLYDVYANVVLNEEPDFIVSNDVSYADDTLFASTNPSNMQQLMNAIVQEGAIYGFEINWSKTVQIQVCTQYVINRPDGNPIVQVREAVYLGGLVTCDGKAGRELVRRLGEGRRVFDGLEKIWSHAGITRSRKLQIYSACVVSKILYSMESLWLLQADKTRLDAFHYKCLRKILGIPCSFISRVPNAHVLEQSGGPMLSQLLLDRQAKQYLKITAQPADNIIKKLVCHDDGQPRTWFSRRRRGRPRQMWAAMVYNGLTW